MTALRLIFEQQKPDADHVLHEQLAKTKRREGRISVLYALDSVNALGDDDLIAALKSQSTQERRHALRLSEPRLDRSETVRQAVLNTYECQAPIVQFQLALTLGECHDPKAAEVLASILAAATDQDIRDAALTSIVDKAGPVLEELLSFRGWASQPNAEPVLAAIVGQIVRQRRGQDLDLLVSLLEDLRGEEHAVRTAALLKAMGRLPSDALAGSDPPQLTRLRELRQSAARSIVAAAEKTLADSDAKPETRAEAIEDLSLDAFDNQRERFEKLLAAQEPVAIHQGVLKACAQYDSPKVSELVLGRWAQFSPIEKSQATDLLLRRGKWALAFAEYLQKQNIRLTTLDPAQATKLENYPSAKVRAIARKLRGQAAPEDRQKVFNDYQEVLATNGDAVLGQEVFQKNCATCHEIGGIGSAVGPNLAAMVNRGAESVLFNVLAPNQEVDPRFMEYVVLTNDGQVITGVIAGETSTAVSLRAPENKMTTVLRVDIDDMHNSGKSLMPEGFEKLIDKKSMANLLAFLKQAAGQVASAGVKK
jgi:putative heme-binding domain-containing protein